MMVKKMKQLLLVLVVFTLVLSVFPPGTGAEGKGTAKNVILLIPDGLGASYMTAARIFKGEELSFERYIKGMMKTDSADTTVTDSAAAGTAMATGYKTDNGKIAVTPEGLEPNSILDAARENGKGTGLVATSRITHATPAVFVSHDASRGNEVVLAQQYINNVDVIFGGGRDMFTLEKDGGKQPERDLVQEAIDAGYQYITTKSEFSNVTNGKVLGLFADAALTYEIDRIDPEQPSLSEMTSQAIEILSENQNGFFLMVEGSQIDWAGHANDITAAITDTLEFERAVDVALEYAKKDKDTLVVVVGDHETGGMVVGTTEGGYADNLSILKNVKASNNVIASQLKKSAEVISLAEAKEIAGTHYIHIRDLVKQLGGNITFDAKAMKAKVKVGKEQVELDFHSKQFNVSGETSSIDMFIETKANKTFVNAKQFLQLLNHDVAIGVTKDKPESTNAYLLDVKATTKPFLGIELTNTDVEAITAVNWDGRNDLVNVLGSVVSKHAYISWGTRNHSGVDVPLYAYGVGAEQFVGLLDNTDLPRVISYLMGTELFTDEDDFVKRLEERRTK